MMIHTCSCSTDDNSLFISLLSKSLENENWICLPVKVVLISCSFTLIYSPKQALRQICIGCFVSQKRMNKCPLMAIWRCKTQTINKTQHLPVWSKWTTIQLDKEERHHPSFTIEWIVLCFISLISFVILLITSVINTFICIFLWSSLSVIVRIITKHFLLKNIMEFKNAQGIITNIQVS